MPLAPELVRGWAAHRLRDGAAGVVSERLCPWTADDGWMTSYAARDGFFLVVVTACCRMLQCERFNDSAQVR